MTFADQTADIRESSGSVLVEVRIEVEKYLGWWWKGRLINDVTRAYNCATFRGFRSYRSMALTLGYLGSKHSTTELRPHRTHFTTWVATPQDVNR